MLRFLALIMTAAALAGCANDAGTQSYDGSTTPRPYVPDDTFGDPCPTDSSGTTTTDASGSTSSATATTTSSTTSGTNSTAGSGTACPGSSSNAASSYPGA